MKLNQHICYRAVLARDERHDGRFFTCVKTTGIYCRPVCPARPPKLQNCLFVPTAAAAQQLGYRPCLRCRPECSPDTRSWQGPSSIVTRGLQLIEDGFLDEKDVASLAGRLGVSDRQLRRIFRQHLGASPIAVAQTRRVLLAKQLLQTTDLPIVQVALASGFGSVRRFNECFQRLYGCSPSQLRRRDAVATPASELTLLLPYRQPYAWDCLLEFLRARAIPGVELVTDDCYSRTISLAGSVGHLHVTNAPQQSALRATVSFPRLECLPTILARLRRLFDLAADPVAIVDALKSDSLLAPLLAERPGLRVPGGWDGFEIAVRAVLGQQVSVKAARTLAGRLVAALGTPLAEPTVPGLTHTFPGPERFTLDAVARLGMPRQRAAAIVGLAEAIRQNPQLFDPKQSLDAAVADLRQLPGIGEWTAQYIAMRVHRESDAFLAADVGVLRALAVNGRRPTPAQVLARAERWRPWRAYALLHLWTAEVTSSQAAGSIESNPTAVLLAK